MVSHWLGPTSYSPSIENQDGQHHEERIHDNWTRSEEHTSELQSRQYLVCRLLLEKKKNRLAPDRQRIRISDKFTSTRESLELRRLDSRFSSLTMPDQCSRAICTLGFLWATPLFLS